MQNGFAQVISHCLMALHLLAKLPVQIKVFNNGDPYNPRSSASRKKNSLLRAQCSPAMNII